MYAKLGFDFYVLKVSITQLRKDFLNQQKAQNNLNKGLANSKKNTCTTNENLKTIDCNKYDKSSNKEA